MDSTIPTLEKLQQEPATEFEGKVKQLIATTTSKLHKLHQNSESESAEDIDCSSELVQIRPNEPERYKVSVSQQFLTEVINNLHDQFPQADLLEAFSIFDPAVLLGQDAIAEEKLKIPLDHYYSNDTGGPIEMDRERCRKEYKDFTSFVRDHAKLKTCAFLQDLAQ